MESGLHFGEFGPGDQGAYSKFYQGQFSTLFNWKPLLGPPCLRKARALPRAQAERLPVLPQPRPQPWCVASLMLGS